MKNPMQESVDFDNEVNVDKKHLYYKEYNKSYYCKENHIIHPNLKSHLKCQSCFNVYDRILFEGVNQLNKKLEIIFKKYY